MVTTRSGLDSRSNAESSTECVASKTKKRILSRHIREHGTETHEICKVCLSAIWVTYGACDSIVQCPDCKDAFHLVCMNNWLGKAEYEQGCPNCRNKIEDFSAWEFDADVFESDDDDYRSEESEESCEEDDESSDCVASSGSESDSMSEYSDSNSSSGESD